MKLLELLIYTIENQSEKRMSPWIIEWLEILEYPNGGSYSKKHVLPWLRNLHEQRNRESNY